MSVVIQSQQNGKKCKPFKANKAGFNSCFFCLTQLLNHSKKRNGLIVCWGKQEYKKSVSGTDNTTGLAITYPIPFTTEPCVNLTHFDGNQFNMSVVNKSITGFSPRYRNINSGTSATTQGCYWLAIGF